MVILSGNRSEQSTIGSLNMKGKIAFIGAGKMATAIGKGLLARNGSAGLKLSAFDPSEAAAKAFTAKTSISCEATLKKALANADIVILAVKPQYIKEALKDAAPLIKNALLISIVAGVSLENLSALSGIRRVVRVMPNTPALAGEGMSCFAPSKDALPADAETAREILSSFGRCRQVPESLMDAVTGLSGSGPAYVFEFIMALADGGVFAGLPRDVAVELAAQTVYGSAKMVLSGEDSPAALRDAVISPGGTTARGVAKLDEGSFRSTVLKAVVAAAERSAELNKLK